MRAAGRDLPTDVVGPKRIIYDYEFIYCNEGDFSVHYEDHSTIARPGQILIIEPGVMHQLDYTNATEVYWVHFDFFYYNNQADLDRYIGINKSIALSPSGYSQPLSRSTILIQPNYTLPECYTVSDTLATRIAFNNLIDLFEEKAYGWSLKCKWVLGQLLLDTVKNLKTSPHISEHKHGLISSIQEYLQENAHRKVTSQELSNHFHYHRDTLGRLFKKETGQTIKAYIQGLRHEKVKQLLLDSDISLDLIAEQCGYTDRSHLIADFKHHRSMTPTEFRNK